MYEPLSASVAYENPETRDLLRSVGSGLGVRFDEDLDLRVAPLAPGESSVMFIEQFASVEAAGPRVYSLAGTNPDLLVIVVVPRPRAAVDIDLLRAGAFDVIDTGPDLEGQLARTVAAARRVIALQEERSRLGSDLAHQDKLAALGLLAAGVGHEVNNPCGAILSNMNAIREQLESVLGRPRFQRVDALEQLAPDWLEAMGDCIGAAKRIHAIVKTLNVFSRRADSAELQPVELNDEIDTVLRLIGKEVRFQADFRVFCDPQLPRILATPNSITQIVTNLVVNALQALESMPPGQRRIEIATGFDETHVMLEVADNGPGIAPENVTRIFDPFFSTKPVGKGTGLGLAITRQLVQKNAGEIFVETEPGNGARFRVLFERQPTLELHAPRISSLPPASSRLRVMIVDDDELTLRSIQRSLGAQFECITLTTGPDALAKLEQDNRIDVVLSDIVMPEMNGFEFYEALRETHPDLAPRTAFLTGGVTSELLRKKVSDTGQPLLAKPLDHDELVKTIRALGLPVPILLPRTSSYPNLR